MQSLKTTDGLTPQELSNQTPSEQLGLMTEMRYSQYENALLKQTLADFSEQYSRLQTEMMNILDAQSKQTEQLQIQLNHSVNGVRDEIKTLTDGNKHFTENINGNITELYFQLKETLLPLEREQVETAMKAVHAEYDRRFQSEIKRLHFWSVLILILSAMILVAIPFASRIIDLATSGNPIGIGILAFNIILAITAIVFYRKKYTNT